MCTGVPREVVPKYSKSSSFVQMLLYILRREATFSPTPSTISSCVIARWVPSAKTIFMSSSFTPRRFISSTSTGMKSKLLATRVGSLQMKATVSPGLMISSIDGQPIGWRIASSTPPLMSSIGGNSSVRTTFRTRSSSTVKVLRPRP